MDEEVREDGVEGAEETDEVTDDAVIEEGDDLADDEVLEDDDLPEGVAEYEGEMASYEITGLVDYTDEGGNIVGQFPVGSIQELPTEIGDKAVEDGQATRLEASTAE